MKRGVACGVVALLSTLLAARGAAAQTFTKIAISSPGQLLDTAGLPQVLDQPQYDVPVGQYWVIEVTKTGSPAYSVVVGPDPTGSSNLAAHFIIRACARDSTIKELAVTEGIGYFAGTAPYGGTQGGSGYSEGSKFMVLGRSAGSTDDVFIFLEKTDDKPLRVYNIGDTNATPVSISARNYYLLVPDTGDFSGRTPRSLFNGLGPTTTIRKAKSMTIDIVDEAAEKLHEIDTALCPALQVPCS
jgi:hypothetical protein